MPCSPLLRRWIEEAGGLLPFEVFVDRALHDPDHGYYRSGARDVGRRGDFSTAVTLSARPARALAAWARDAAPGLPLVEIGPGGGQLAAALLREHGGPLHLVEPSPRLRAVQAERLADIELRVREIVDGIASEGVEVKGIDPVLLDFPGMLDGRPVYLCWHEGEPRVAWYHDLHAGFAGRRPIEAPDDPRWTWWH